MNEIANLNHDGETKLTGLEIAVIGMSGRFPGARNLDEFWENIKTGAETVSHFSDQELLEYGVDPELLRDPNYVKAKGVLEDLELFDAQFFGYNPSEARGMDPQIRIMLESAWHLLEDAGYDPDTYSGSIGLYVGASTDVNWTAQFLLSQRLDNLSLIENTLTGYKDLLSTMVSYRLNLKGPSYSIYTACSTSLASIHLACRALLTGECRMAAAGGVTVTLPKKFGYLCQEGMAYSVDGHCRSFDARANGTLFGDGVGLVMLKQLEDATADGDRIYAIIKASAANNDGRRKVGFTAPSVEGQVEVIQAALYMAEVEPESIRFIECHGTGTLMGDPIEIEGLTKAFNTDKKQFCAVASIKSNVGHLHAAAGVAGFIRAVLTLKHKLIPIAANFETPNPGIDFKNSPFYVNTEIRELKNNGYPLRAGVSSFGIGGTNVHVILEEAPGQIKEKRSVSIDTRPYKLILLSARTESSILQAAQNLANYLGRRPDIELEAVAYTLQKGRRAFQYRKMWACPDTRELIDNLAAPGETAAAQRDNNPIIFMFSGQGSEYNNMGLEIYRTETYFRQEIDRCFFQLEAIVGVDIKHLLYPVLLGDGAGGSDKDDKGRTRYNAPIKFIFEYCLARLMIHWGIKPTAMIGHSFGEYLAACLAGVFSFEETLKLVVLRAELFSQLEEGSMMRIFLSEQEILDILNETGLNRHISLAAINMEKLCTVSGTVEAVEDLRKHLTEKGHKCQKLWVERAGHSKMVEAIMDRFREKVAETQRHKPGIPYISGLSGSWITDEEAVDPAYYSRHLREPIRFLDGLTELFKIENAIFVQIGADLSLANFVNRHHCKKPGNHVLNLIQYSRGKESDVKFLLEKIGKLWLYGIKPDWEAFYDGKKRSIISLPGYAFDPTPYLSKVFYSAKFVGPMSTQQEEARVPGDLRAAPLEFKQPQLKTIFVAPGNENEKAIIDIWQNTIGLSQIGVHDSFFELGGDSLLALSVVSQINKKLHVNIPVSEIFARPTASELARYISDGNNVLGTESRYPQKIPDPGNINKPFPLTDIQISYLIGRDKAFEMGGVSTHGYGEIETKLDIGRLNESLVKVIRRHPMMRAVIIGHDRQIILKETPEYRIQVEDLSHLEAGAREKRILEERARMAHFIFNPERWPLFEIKAFKIFADTHYLFIGIDVLFSDGASILIMVRDLLAYYENREDQLSPLEFTFRDYMLAYEELRETDLYRRDKEYWQEKLENFPTAPALPLACNPAEITSPHFSRCLRKFSEVEWKKLKEIAKAHNITPSAFLATAYADVLAYWSNQPRLAFSLTVFNRIPFHKDVNQIVGDFTSLILLGLDLRPHTSFWEKAAEVQRVLFEALEHRHYDGVEFIRDLGRYHGMTGKVIIPFIFTSVLFSGESLGGNILNRLGEVKIGLTQASQAFIDFQASEEDGKLVVNWDYVEDLFHGEEIRFMFEQYVMIIAGILAGNDDSRPGPDEKLTEMIRHYNRTDESIPPTFLHRMFVDQAARTPNRTAVEFHNDSISYRELDERSNQIARYLVEKGVKRNEPVGVLTRRCIETIVSVLGVLKSAGAYVPIDPDYPQDRQDYIFTDSNCRLLITPELYQEENPAQYPAGEMNNINSLDDLAYVIYTSGSTGRPKGVMETHREVSNTIIDITRKFGVNERDKILGISSMCFDLSVYDVFGSLSVGACLVLISSQKDVKEIIETLAEKKITIWNSVPAILDMTLENIDFYLKKDALSVAENVVQPFDVKIKEKSPAHREGEKIYFWSPSAYWKIQKNKLRIDTYYFTGAALEVFPDFYFLAQDGLTVDVVMKNFPAVNSVALKQFIDQLIEKRILVSSILSPEEVFRPQARLFKNTYSEEILYNEAVYNEYKKLQLSRVFENAAQGKLELGKSGHFPAIIKDRRSYREFDIKPVPFTIFSILLSVFKQTHGKDVRYYYASAGGLYPIDIFIYVKQGRVENTEKGLYYYNPIDNSLNLVDGNVAINDDIHFTGNKEIYHMSAFSIFMIYDAGVTMPKYRENGYFYALIDCGIMVGALTQASELLGIGLCSIGSVNFQKIRDYFKLSDNQVLLHTVELGLKPGHTAVSKEISWETNDITTPGRKSLPGIETYEDSLRLIMLSGDWIPLSLPGKIKKYFPHAETISLGGATEGSIWSIYYPVKQVENTWKSIPYGYPLANQRFYVLDFQGRYCPVGVPGELYIGGVGVAEGYMGDKEKTAASFIRHNTLGRLYRTGDFGVFRKEGYIEFLGRRDSQVKIRGYRIELGEIETRLLEIDFVKEAVVIVKEHGGDKVLCAFLVLHPNYNATQWSQAIDNLRKLLAIRLPDYMIPSSFIRLEQLPVTSTGKIDRKALSGFEIELQDNERYIAPGNELEKKLERIFAKILGVEKVGVADNFFQLGGDSLKAIAAVTEIRKQLDIDLPLGDLFVYITIKSLSDYIYAEFEPVIDESEDSGRKANFLTAEADWEHIHEPFNLTNIQRAYVLGRYDYFEMGGTSTHAYQEIEAAVDIERVNTILNKLIERHPMLRTVILDDNSQKILDEIPEYRIAVDDFRGSDAETLRQAIQKERERMSHHMFRTDVWPLFEIKAFRLSDEKYYFFTGFDLIIGDAASMYILNSEFGALYSNPGLQLPELQFTFRDYILACESIKESKQYAIDREYWMSQVEDFPRSPGLPFKCNPSEIASPRFKRLAKFFSPSEWEKLQEIAQNRNLTSAVLLCAVYADVLVHWSNQPRTALNLPIFNRHPFHEDVNRLVGDFTSVILLKVEFEPGMTFWQKAEKLKHVLMEALEHKYYEGVEFIGELARRDGAGMQAIMPIVFTSLFLDIDADSLQDTEKIGEVKMSISQTSQVFIDSQIYAMDGGLNINWDYVEDLFDGEVITAMFDRNTKLLDAIIRGEEDYVLQLGENEIALIEAYNDTGADIPPTTLHGLFTSRAALSPNRTAVEFLDERITYRDLDERSNRVARYLREQGVKPNDLVGLIGERCIDTVVNVMGILKAGGAYVPVDPEYPEDRKTYIFESSNCMLTLGPGLYQAKKLYLYSKEELNNINTPEDLAYIIHTSGSTGQPKGVIETHRASGNTIIDINQRFAVDENDRIMGISSLCFDLSVYDIFGTLGIGATLVLIKTLKDVTHMIETLENKKITLWNSVPAIMDLVVDELPHNHINRQLRVVMLSGDWIPLTLPEKIKEHFPNAKTFSLGGATEASIWSIYYPIEEVKNSWKSIPYGMPLANQEFYVLDYNMRLCPVEVVGELYIGGIGLASGYLNDIRKTVDSFIYHPRFGALYRTGDYSVFHKEGYIEFLGRRDQQVKLKGHRIELGEIENQLLKHEGVKAAIVIVRKGGEHSLCAYIVPLYDGAVTIPQLKEYLLEKLPGYMIPSYFVLFESIPLTPNGKINKNALPEPVLEIGIDYEAPRNKLEEELVEIWSEVLAVEKEKIGINDSFFDKGGHSIIAIALISRIYKNFNVKLPLGELFKAPTVKGISEYLKEATKGKYSDVEAVEKKEYYPMSAQQKGLYFIQKLNPENISYNMSMVLAFKEDAQRKKLADILRALIKRHEGLRTSFEIINDQPVQRVHYDVLFELEYNEMDEEAARKAVMNFVKPFDLSIAPLLRAKLIKISNEKYILLLDFHHIIVDAISNSILQNDFTKLYSNRSAELTPLYIQYSSYSEWHFRLSRSGELDRQEVYWLNRFSGELPLLKMATDFPRPGEKNLKGARVDLKLDTDLIDKVKTYIRKSETTVYIFMLSVYTVLLSKYSGQDDIVVGSPITGRTHPDLYNIIGLFANMLPMRNFPKENFRFLDFLKDVKTNALNAFENQDYQFTELVSKLNVAKDLSRHPLFDAVLALNNDNTGPGDSLNKCFTFESYDYEFSDLKFDLLLDVFEGETSIHFSLNYSVSLFKVSTAEKILQHIAEILRQVCEDDGIMLKDIKISHDLITVESVFPLEESDTFGF